jgi:hypothetical protein
MLTGHLQGWIGVRRERHLHMLIFLTLSGLYLAGWGVMFFSTTFRWTFTTWFFFSVMSSASVFLTVVGMILGIVCRLNFGKGLVHYRESRAQWIGPHRTDKMTVDAAQQHSEEDRDIEKIPFPASEEPPAFEKHKGDWSPESQYSFDTTVHFVTFPEPALQRHPDDVEIYSPKNSIHTHSRQGSGDSNHSHQQQRWIIE